MEAHSLYEARRRRERSGSTDPIPDWDPVHGRRPVARCGTPQGYRVHRREGTTPCAACAEAVRQASRDRYRRKALTSGETRGGIVYAIAFGCLDLEYVGRSIYPVATRLRGHRASRSNVGRLMLAGHDYTVTIAAECGTWPELIEAEYEIITSRPAERLLNDKPPMHPDARRKLTEALRSGPA